MAAAVKGPKAAALHAVHSVSWTIISPALHVLVFVKAACLSQVDPRLLIAIALSKDRRLGLLISRCHSLDLGSKYIMLLC